MAKFQVSSDMTFDKKNDRDTIFDYLNGKKNLGFSQPGDFMLVQNDDQGTYRVACRLRTVNQNDRDTVFTYLDGKKANARQDKPGRLERHLCRHDDDGLPCDAPDESHWGPDV